MAFDEALAERMRAALAAERGVSEKRMFGGLAFLRDGKMFCGIVKDELMVRVGRDEYERALSRPHVREMDFTGRPMVGYVFVEPEGLGTRSSLARWLDLGLNFVRQLPSATPHRRTSSGGRHTTAKTGAS